jgi:2',3'-cyclic-nucleotide 2'-phosphodiesterase/3'-nucleotidase
MALPARTPLPAVPALLAASLLAASLLAASLLAASHHTAPIVVVRASAPAAETASVTLLATTDLHAHLLPYDYFTRQPAARGLAAAASLVEEVRREMRHTLLVDVGDTIQGSPLASVYQASVAAGTATAPEPMMSAMNALGYDAMVVGNHEFNFGPGSLEAARRAARFPWLSSNVRREDGRPAFVPFVLKDLGGVKVAIVGVTTTAVPQWEKPENIRGLVFEDPVEALDRTLAELERERPDVVVAAVHGGLDRDPLTGVLHPGEKPGENPVFAIAERFPQLAAIVYGHTHRREEGRRVNGLLLVQPRNWGMEVARIDLALERAPGGRWHLAGASSRLLAVTPETAADPRVVEIARPYHEAAERWLDREVAVAPADLTAARGRLEDTALVDAIHEVQLHAARADVSFTALFQPRVRVSRGPVTARDVAALYVYDNELYAIEGNGRMVREALENAARYFRTCPEPSCARGPLVDPDVRGYNYDMAQGVEYEIDLTRPAGQRVRNLRRGGVPLRDEEPLRIALNSYRAAGSSGYTMFQGARVAWRSGRDIRDLMVDYYREKGRLPERPDGNWRLVPPRAVETLAQEEAR